MKMTIDAFCTPVGKTSGRGILALIHQCYPFLLLPIPALFIDKMFDCSILAAFHQCGTFLLIQSMSVVHYLQLLTTTLVISVFSVNDGKF